MLTVFLLLALAAFAVTIASAVGKAPLWVAVLILTLDGIAESNSAGEIKRRNRNA